MNKNPDYSIKTRAKTFYFASFFFNRNIKEEIATLYIFCRYIDDISDSGELNKTQAKQRLKNVIKDLKKLKSKNTILMDFINLMIKKNIQIKTPLMLISGVMQDLGKVKLKNLEELIIYSYKVAGTVGLMVCNILEVKNKKLKFKGIQLGIAMQITNIIRDIDEDLKNNRIYFPLDFLTIKNDKPKQILNDKELQKQFSKDIEKLKDFSDLVYTNSRIGIYKLPIHYRLPIALASRLYQSIGVKIRNHKYDIWNKRHYLSFKEKIIKFIIVLFEIFFMRNIVENKKIEKEINKILLILSDSYCD
ncbi:MAG: phytoene/squalene synthase family protein [Alphaproteobacteria bacterium]